MDNELKKDKNNICRRPLMDEREIGTSMRDLIIVATLDDCLCMKVECKRR
jgi:hypothetical protein